MRAIFLVAFRNLISRPGRAVSCSLGIALGLGIVMAVLIVDHNTILTQLSLKPPAYGTPDVEIKPRRPRADKIEEQMAMLGRLKELRDPAALFQNTLSIRSVTGKRIDLSVFGLDERAADGFNAYRILEGEDLDFSAPPNLLLSQKAAERLEVGPGDRVRAWPPRTARPVCKDGKLIQRTGPETQPPPVRDFRVSGILAEEHLGMGMRAIIPFHAGLNLFQEGYLLPIFWAKLAPGIDLNSVQALLKNEYTVEKPYEEALVGESLEEKAFRNGARICALLSLLLGLYIIFNSMSISLMERVRQIGLLRAMGLTRFGLTGLFLLEGIFLTLAGAVLSIAITAAIVYYMTRQGITTLGFGRPLELLGIPWAQLAGVMILGIFFALSGMIHPVGKAWGLSVIQAIRRGAIEYENRPFKGVGRILFLIFVLLLPVAYFSVTPMLTGRFLELFLLVLYTGASAAMVVGLLLFFPSLLHFGIATITRPLRRLFKVTGRLAGDAMAASRLRIFSTVSGLALVFAAIFVIVSVTDGLKSETASFADKNLVDNLFVRAKRPGAVQAAELEETAGVKAVLNLSAVIQSPFPVRGVDTKTLRRLGVLAGIEDRASRLEGEDWIIISRRLAKMYDYQVDDRVKLSTPQAGLKVFRVLAVVDACGFYPDNRAYAVIGLDKMISYFCVAAEPGVRWSLYLDAGQDEAAVQAALTERLLDRATVLSGASLKAEYLSDLDKNFSIFTVIILLVAVLAGVSILNSLVIAEAERRREVVLLRIMGLTPWQLKGILLMEAAGLGGLGGLFGILLGVPITWLIVNGLSRISYLDMEMSLKPSILLFTFAGAIFVSLAASIYPVLRQGSADLMEAIKYE